MIEIYKYSLKEWANYDETEKMLIIQFDDDKLTVLGEHLSDMRRPEIVKKVIQELKEYMNSSDKSRLVSESYNDYWNYWEFEQKEWEKYTRTAKYDSSEKLFTLYGYDSGLNLIIREKDNFVILENEYQDYPIIELPISDLVSILNDWYNIISKYESKTLNLY